MENEQSALSGDASALDWRAAMLAMLPQKFIDEKGLVSKLAAAPDLPDEAAVTFVRWVESDRQTLHVGDEEHGLAEYSLDLFRGAYRWLQVVPAFDEPSRVGELAWYCDDADSQAVEALPEGQRCAWAVKLLASAKDRERRFEACTEFSAHGDWRKNPQLPENRRAAHTYLALLKAEEEQHALRRRMFKAAAAHARSAALSPRKAPATSSIARGGTRTREAGRSTSRSSQPKSGSSGSRGSPGRPRCSDYEREPSRELARTPSAAGVA